MRGCKESFSCKPPWFGVPELWLTTQGPASRHEAMSNNADLGGRRMMRRQWGIINELAKRGARFRAPRLSMKEATNRGSLNRLLNFGFVGWLFAAVDFLRFLAQPQFPEAGHVCADGRYPLDRKEGSNNGGPADSSSGRAKKKSLKGRING